MLAAAAITSGCSGASVDPMQQQSIIAQSKEAVRARLAQPDAALTDVFMRKTNISRFTLPVHIVCGKARSSADNLIVNQRVRGSSPRTGTTNLVILLYKINQTFSGPYFT